MDEDNFFDELQPSTSGLTLSQMNNKSSVLCPETQDITSQYLALQQLDAHQKMIARAKGVVDTSPPKSMQSYRSVSSQQKRRLLNHLNKAHIPSQNYSDEDFNGPSSSRLPAYHSEEEEVGSTNASTNKAIQTGIPLSNFTSKTAEKISWYLEALSLRELQSEYFTFLNSNDNHSRHQEFAHRQSKKKIIRGDIMDWHREHFIEPKKPFSPRILAESVTKSKVREMRCYNPPFRKKKTRKTSSLHSSDTFESYEDEDENEELSQTNGDQKSSDDSSVEQETLINRIRDDPLPYAHHSPIPIMPHYKRDYVGSNSYPESSLLNKSEEDKYLDFLSKVTEDILRSGVYSDKAIQQAFEFQMQFYKDDPNKEKFQSLLEQVLEGLKISNEDTSENVQPRTSFSFLSRSNTPPEKETSGSLFQSDFNRTANDSSSNVNESIDDTNEFDNS